MRHAILLALVLQACTGVQRADRTMPRPVGRWSTDGKVTLWLHPNLSETNHTCIEKAAGHWGGFELRDMGVEEVTAYDIYGRVSLQSAVVLEAPPERPGAATTSLELSDAGILSAEARLGSPDMTDRACVHELGHVLGLEDHPKDADPNLLMNPASDATGCEILEEESAWLGTQGGVALHEGAHVTGHKTFADPTEEVK